MQISRSLLLVCAVGCALLVRGADNAAQIKAREALQKKLNETQPAATPAPQQAPAAQAPKTPTPAPAQAGAVPAPTPAHAEAIEKARQALHQKMLEVGAQPAPAAVPSPAPAPAPAVATPAPAPTPAAVAAPAPAPASVAAPAPAAAPAASPEDIAKARELMRQKMQTLIAQEPTGPTPAAAPASAPAPPPPAAVPAAPAQAATAPAPQPPPAPVQPTLASPDDIAKAREAMRQKLSQIEAEAPAAAPAVAKPAAPAPEPAVAKPSTPPAAKPAAPAVAKPAAPPAPAAAPPAAAFANVSTQPGMDDENIFKVRAALHQTMDQVVTPAASGEKKAVRPPVFQRNPAFPPLQGPDLVLPAEKQERLAELLRRYRADEISPEQYHAERAKLLGQ